MTSEPMINLYASAGEHKEYNLWWVEVIAKNRSGNTIHQKLGVPKSCAPTPDDAIEFLVKHNL